MRKKSKQPEHAAKINDAVSHLRRTLRMHPDKIKRSLSDQITYLVRYWFNKRLCGETYIHPGISKIMKATRYGRTQTKANIRFLKSEYIIEAALYESGGSNKATHFGLTIDCLIDWMIEIGTNPNPVLISKLRDVEGMTSKQPRKNIVEGVAEGVGKRPLYIGNNGNAIIPLETNVVLIDEFRVPQIIFNNLAECIDANCVVEKEAL